MHHSPDASTAPRPSGPRRLALAALLASISPALAPAQGPAAQTGPPTFTRDVAAILQAKCQNCHRRDQVGPFALGTYEQARKRSTDIATVVSDRSMPPWKPAPGVGPKLKHDQSLTPQEIAILEAWADAGAPRGETADMPPPQKYAEGWALGEPDLVLQPAEDFAYAADAPDTYRCFVIPTNLAKDTYISAIDFRPGNAKVVHHIEAFVDVTGDARKRDEAEPGPGYVSFAGAGIAQSEEISFWTAGHVPHHLPHGVGQRLPRGSDLILQVHYHATGKPEVDRTRVGVYFSREPVRQALHWNTASNSEFTIPADHANVEVRASWFIPTPVEVLAVSPHMHLLGKDMRITAALPSGRTQDLIHIPSWDPSWQGSYHFQKPIALPTGSVVKVIAHFDNTAHARNPNNPPRRVDYGTGKNDEMCEGFIAVVKAGQDLTRPGARDDLAEVFERQRVRTQVKQQAKSAR